MTTYLLQLKNGFGLQTAFDDVEVFDTPELREGRLQFLAKTYPRLKVSKLDRQPLTGADAPLDGYQDFTDTGLFGEGRDEGWGQAHLTGDDNDCNRHQP